jgi:hypothetical protein
VPADSEGSGRGSSESHQHSETLPPRATAASNAASRMARHASAPPGQQHLITHVYVHQRKEFACTLVSLMFIIVTTTIQTRMCIHVPPVTPKGFSF